MLEISQAVEYGVRGIIHMAHLGDNKTAQVKEIAESEDISPTFLHKIFQRMTQERILNSKRGVGYTLARTPDEITMLDIIQAIEGPILMRRCIVDKSYCERAEDCKLSAQWLDIQQVLVAKLSSITVSDMLNSKPPP